jgi:hypothetical protein
MSDVTDMYSDFPGDYWKAAELEGTKPKPLTITTVEKAEMNDGKQKPVTVGTRRTCRGSRARPLAVPQRR